MKPDPYANTPENWTAALIVFLLGIPVAVWLALSPPAAAWFGLVMCLVVAPALLIGWIFRR